MFCIQATGSRRLRAAVAVGLVCTGTACWSPPRVEGGGAADQSALLGRRPSLGPARTGGAADPIVIVQMHFDVLRVELPCDRVHHSAKAWNYVDELRCDPTRAALLRRNGLRLGVASAHNWPALRALFDACQARVLRASHAVQRGLPFAVELDAIEEDETIFLVTADNRVSGRTFDRGRKHLHLEYTVNAEDGSTTLVILPEIHRLSRSPHWQRRNDGFERVSEYEGQVYQELACRVTVGADEFLVIGPDSSPASGLSVGQRFLTRDLEGRRHETILCVTPRPFRTELAER